MNTEELGDVSKEIEKELDRIEIENNSINLEDNNLIKEDSNLDKEDNNLDEENNNLDKEDNNLNTEDDFTDDYNNSIQDDKESDSTEEQSILQEENVSECAEDISDTDEIKLSKLKAKWKSIPTWGKVFCAVFLALLIVGITGIIYVRSLVGKINYESPDDVMYYTEEPTGGTNENVEGDNNIPTEMTEPTTGLENVNRIGPRFEEGVTNILLIGEDRKIEKDGRGPADVIIIATINTNTKALKLTSIMRDTYVSIPGYRANKINYAYTVGGAPLLLETIEQNFDIDINGYAYVYNASFEALINKLGGVEITLTAAEASYLRRTNYISNPAYRNVYEGRQTLNGNQALGYSRVRYVGNDDFERTNRHKRVLTAIFDKYKKVSLIKALEVLNYILPQITTNMSVNEIINYATTVVTLGASEIETFRIPIDGAYNSTYVGELAVLIPELKTNIEEFHKFIFNDEEIEEDTTEETTEEITTIFQQG